MAFAFSFPTVAAYRSAKNSAGTAEIYNALAPSSATGGTTNVARAAVSFIAELGRSVVDSINVCVPFAEGGRPGDVLCYSSTYGYFWEKSPCSTWNISDLGQTYHDSTTWPSSFIRIGYCFYRKGKTAKICALEDSSSAYAWCSNTSEEVAGVFTATIIMQGFRMEGVNAGIRQLCEGFYADKYGTAWPLPRTLWDEAVNAAKTGATSSGVAQDTNGNPSGTSYTASGGVATITVAAAGETLTVNPADWGYDFNLWYRENVEALFPGPNGAGGQTSVLALRDANGVNNDGIRNTRVLHAAAATTPAATYAIGYSVNAPDFGAGKWWIQTIIEAICLAKVKILLERNGGRFTSGARWTSDQLNAAYAWNINFTNGTISRILKSTELRVRPISEIYIP